MRQNVGTKIIPFSNNVERKKSKTLFSIFHVNRKSNLIKNEILAVFVSNIMAHYLPLQNGLDVLVGARRAGLLDGPLDDLFQIAGGLPLPEKEIQE